MKDRDYEIGYGKPPKASQFKPNMSGNPGGRPKGARGLKTDLAEELEAKETIKIGGKRVTGTRQRQAVRTLCIRAANGDLKAIQQLIPLIMSVLGPEDRNPRKEQLSLADQQLLASVLGDQASEAVLPSGGSGSSEAADESVAGD